MSILYRAKKLGTNEYVIGYFLKLRFNSWFKHYLLTEHGERIEIDPSTLSISFEGMFDSEGTKIFASLSRDGKGGDIASANDGQRECVFIYHKYAMCIDLEVIKENCPAKGKFEGITPQQYKYRTKVIGIKQ